jgi:hypothetical protein
LLRRAAVAELQRVAGAAELLRRAELSEFQSFRVPDGSKSRRITESSRVAECRGIVHC